MHPSRCSSRSAGSWQRKAFQTFRTVADMAPTTPTLITVDRADAASLTSAVVQYLTGIGLDLQKISAISTDGASVMIGKNNGVVARLRMRIPHLASTQCVAHREALAASDAADAVPELYMVDDIIRGFADLISRSNVKYEKFHNIQHVFCKTNLGAQGIHTVRWLSRGEAVRRFLEILPAAIVIDVTLMSHLVDQTRMRMKSRYLNFSPHHHFGSGEKLTLNDFIQRHQKMDKREVKAEGVDSDGCWKQLI
ncbi:unnamed protein product [Closterium sp. NIES-53]